MEDKWKSQRSSKQFLKGGDIFKKKPGKGKCYTISPLRTRGNLNDTHSNIWRGRGVYLKKKIQEKARVTPYSLWGEEEILTILTTMSEGGGKSIYKKNIQERAKVIPYRLWGQEGVLKILTAISEGGGESIKKNIQERARVKPYRI